MLEGLFGRKREIELKESKFVNFVPFSEMPGISPEATKRDPRERKVPE
jgi:hypothetical protein